MSFFTYILHCSDDSYYIGSTYNLEKRLEKHQSGKACEWTRNRRPVKIVYTEEYKTLQEARKREQQLKKWTRKKKENLIYKIWTSPTN